MLVQDLLEVSKELWSFEAVAIVVFGLSFLEAAISALASPQVSTSRTGQPLGLNHPRLVSLNLLGLLAVNVSEPPRNLPDGLLVLSIDALVDAVERVVFEGPELSSIVAFEDIQISHLLAVFKYTCNPVLILA